MVATVALEGEVVGDTVIYDLTLSRTGALAGWMSGGTIRFMAKLREKDADADALIVKSTDDGITWADQAAAAPTATITINPEDWPDSLQGKARVLKYQVEIEEANGRKETPQRGDLPTYIDVIRGA